MVETLRSPVYIGTAILEMVSCGRLSIYHIQIHRTIELVEHECSACCDHESVVEMGS